MRLVAGSGWQFGFYYEWLDADWASVTLFSWWCEEFVVFGRMSRGLQESAGRHSTPADDGKDTQKVQHCRRQEIGAQKSDGCACCVSWSQAYHPRNELLNTPKVSAAATLVVAAGVVVGSGDPTSRVYLGCTTKTCGISVRLGAATHPGQRPEP
jgi:hypothetical protein